MIRRLLKLVAYRRAPLGTFALLHPRRALKWGVVLLVLRKLLQPRRQERPTQERPPA